MRESVTSITLLTADAIASADLAAQGNRQAPTALLIERTDSQSRILAAGRASDLTHHPATDSAQRLHRPGCVLMPALVNAHTHLDLTHIGPRPHHPSHGFMPWIDLVRRNRHTDPGEIRASVARGCALLRQGGVGLVGDIAGAVAGSPSLEPWQALAVSGLAGTSFIEFFAIGTREQASLDRLDTVLEGITSLTRGQVRLGLQPHAPNTVSPRAYDHAGALAQRLDLPLITHLAESPEEREFVATTTGPQRRLLEDLGLWTDEIAQTFIHGSSPVEHLHPFIRKYGSTLVHLNQCSDRDLELLARARARVVYCPRASDYFGAQRHFGAHRYREMLKAGIEVALGTDSVINLPSGVVDEAGLGLSTLDEARFLFQRDGTDPDILLKMMTTHGARAIGWEDRFVTLGEGSTPVGILAIPASGEGTPAERVLRSGSAPEFLFGEN